MSTELLIRYNIDQIFECQEENTVLPKELEQYCYNIFKNNKSILHELKKSMDDITTSHSNGINPNDIALRNRIRDNLNKINSSNYDTILDLLISLNYTCENHFTLLAKELVIKSMNDMSACKGLESNKNQLSPSEIYMKIANEFSGFFITHNNKEVRFRNVLTKVCQQYFKEFINQDFNMDQNNIHRVNNYKGFMNMIGLTYYYNIFPRHIVFACFKSIVNVIINSNLPQEECDNYYSGYERLMNKFLNKFENSEDDKANASLNDEFNAVKSTIINFNNSISEAIKKANTQKVKPPIRKFSIMVHENNIKRFNMLTSKFQEADDFNWD